VLRLKAEVYSKIKNRIGHQLKQTVIIDLFHTAFRLPPSAFRLPPSAFRLPPPF